ncbi:MAG: coiled-coil domain-containing protein, partial [Methermicoccaceae archaeon]
MTADTVYKIDERKQLWLICPSCNKSFNVPAGTRDKIIEELDKLGLTVGGRGVISKDEEEDKPELIEYQGEEYTPEDLIFVHGLEGLHYLMRLELEKALKEAPVKFSDKMIAWILDHFDRYDHYKQDPHWLANAIMNYKRVSPQVVNDIVMKVFSIPKRYQRTIEFAVQQRPELFMPLSFNQNYQLMYLPYQHQQQQYQYQPQDQQNQNPQILLPWPLQINPRPQSQPQETLTKDDILKILDEREKRLLEILEEREKKKKEEEKYEKLLEAVSKLAEEVEELKKTEVKVEDRDRDRESKQSDLERLRNDILSLKDELRRLRDSGKKEENSSPADAIRHVRQILEEVEKLRGKSEIDGLRDEIKRVRDELSKWTGEIDEKKLKLRELELEKEIKET